jgi:hypothetical protein
LRVFFDSSALAKRYYEEPGSPRVEEIFLSASSLGLSVLAISEVASALCRRRREGELSPAQYQQAKRVLLLESADADLIPLNEVVLTRAVSILERWSLRSSDALHVASAAEWSSDLFVTADDRQLRAAKGLGLKVERIAAR